MRLAYHVLSSPVGLLFLARTPVGLRYLEFMDRKSLKRMIGGHEAENPNAKWEPSLLELKPWAEQLEDYFVGDRREFTLPLDPVGSEFQLEVWAALQRIPYAETRSYGDVARQIGQPNAMRAVGLANNQNPIAIVVPCHRVIGADGKLVGYGGGLPRKRWLIDHEARFAQPVGRTLDLFAPPAPVALPRHEAEVAAMAKEAAASRIRNAKHEAAEVVRKAKLAALREKTALQARAAAEARAEAARIAAEKAAAKAAAQSAAVKLAAEKAAKAKAQSAAKLAAQVAAKQSAKPAPRSATKIPARLAAKPGAKASMVRGRVAKPVAKAKSKSIGKIVKKSVSRSINTRATATRTRVGVAGRGGSAGRGVGRAAAAARAGTGRVAARRAAGRPGARRTAK